MKFSNLFSILVVCGVWSFVAYSFLEIKYPGKGLRVIENIFKETTSFEKALGALKEGHRIRRKTERKGYAKVVITEGKNHKEKFGTYWVGSNSEVSDYCSFSIEDVTANDWIIDE